MKLFWKIFLSIITVITVIFCVSGHILIYSFFDSILKNEIEAAQKSNLSFCLSLESAVSDEKEAEMLEQDVVKKAKAVRALDAADLKQLWVYSENRKALYRLTDSEEVHENKDLLVKMDVDTTGYEIKENEGKYYLYTANMISINENSFYVQCVNEITDIFEQKEKQYQIFVSGMLVLIVVTIVLSLGLTFWIINPVIDELRMAAVRQEEFTGSFAHELKTPLTSIIGYADMLRSKKMTEETRMVYGNYVFQQGKRLEALAGKMMKLIVLEKKDFVMREVYLQDMFEQIQDELQFILKEKKIVFEAKTEEVSVKAEPDLLKTVFLNLIDNSIKAIGENGCILIRAENLNDEVTVYVADTGKGIPQNEIEKVTESFYMVDKSRKYEGGSAGLGLSICKKVLELHRARMEITSEEGKGTTILIRFKVAS